MKTTPLLRPAHAWQLRLPRGGTLQLGQRPRVVGVLNLTPDSFSDGGQWLEPLRAVDRALAMIEEGAEVLDLGAESSRPGGGVYGAGASEVAVEEELRRLLPVLEALRPLTPVPLSVDTRKAEVARQALAAGADVVNDVTALSDPQMADVVAQAGCPLILMHSRGPVRDMQRHASYRDVVAEVRSELAAALERARHAGISEDQVVLDPGIGFAKGGRHNLALLRRLDAFDELGRPLLVGASRKSFIGELTGEPPATRLAGSLAAAAWAAHHGTALLRVHDVAATAQFLEVWNAIATAEEVS